MTASDHKKVLKQLRFKESKLPRFLKYNVPKERKSGKNLRVCRRCGRRGGHVSKYGLNLCRQCLRETATTLGFKKYN